MLAIILAALPICIAIWTAVGWLYNAHVMLSAEMVQTRLNLRRYEAALARQHEIEPAVARSEHSVRDHYWFASAEADAAETLQRQLRAVIDAAGGDVQQIEPIPTTSKDGHAALSLRVTLEATATELLETLYSIESYRPYLFLDRLHVRVLEKRARPGEAPDALLQASLDVRGYLESNRQDRQ
jgi:hypothetical protein